MTTRRRSFWAWGYEDRFPAPSARQGLAAFARAALGLDGLAPRELPVAEAIALRPPRIEAPAELAAICSADHRDRLAHTYGKGYRDLVRGLAGDFGAAPDLVAHPRDEADVARVLAWASAAGVAVIPYGGGTSVVGGVEADVGPRFDAVVSLDLGGLDAVLEVDPGSRLARVQAGATGPRLEAQLASSGFTLRHFPQSFEHSTVGGWIATRAGGHFATVYTHIDDLVAATRLVTPAGTLATLPLPGSGAGPAPDRLVIGSEGALGVITEAWLRLHRRPTFRASASVRFRDWDAAVDAAREIAQAKLFPANCRLLDAREAGLNRVATDGRHVLLLGFESADHPVGAWLELALAIARRHGGDCPDGPRVSGDGAPARADQADAWRRAFLDAPYLQSALVSMGALVDTFETACTWSAFPAMHRELVARVRDTIKRVAGKPFLSCRFTHVYPDGPAPYYTFIAPARAGEELAQWAAIKAAASEVLAAHGATITHHHAVGRVHRPWYEREVPALFRESLAAAKRTLDPAGILNPGALLPAT